PLVTGVQTCALPIYRRIDTLPVDPNSLAYVNSISATAGLHADFGSGLYGGGPIGIPFVTVPGTQPFVPILFTLYGDESDPGPYRSEERRVGKERGSR